MPITDDIMDHEVIGRERRAGKLEGERAVILRLMEKRFDTVPEWARLRVEAMSLDELDKIELEASTLEELLG